MEREDSKPQAITGNIFKLNKIQDHGKVGAISKKNSSRIAVIGWKKQNENDEPAW